MIVMGFSGGPFFARVGTSTALLVTLTETYTPNSLASPGQLKFKAPSPELEKRFRALGVANAN